MAAVPPRLSDPPNHRQKRPVSASHEHCPRRQRLHLHQNTPASRLVLEHRHPNLPNLAENFGVNRLGRKNWRTAAFAASIHNKMGLFSKKDDYNRMFSRNERVVAAYDLPGVPERTGGKIKMVNGFEWQRYWVFFDNGVQLGSLDGSALLRPHHWERWRSEREEVMAEMKARMEAVVAEQEALLELAENPESAAPAAELPESDSDADADAAETGAGDSGAAPSGEAAALLEKLPDHLVERSRLARTRLGG